MKVELEYNLMADKIQAVMVVKFNESKKIIYPDYLRKDYSFQEYLDFLERGIIAIKKAYEDDPDGEWSELTLNQFI